MFTLTVVGILDFLSFCIMEFYIFMLDLEHWAKLKISSRSKVLVLLFRE